MVKQKTVKITNITIFSIVGILHLLRAVFDWELIIAGWNVPITLNLAVVLLTAIMIYINYEAKR